MTEGRVVFLWPNLIVPNGGAKFIFEAAKATARKRSVEVVVDSASHFWRDEFQRAGIPLTEIDPATPINWRYWLQLRQLVRRDVRAVATRAAGASAVVSTYFPMQWVGAEVAREQGLRHVHLCFEPFPMFHARYLMKGEPWGRRLRFRAYTLAYRGLDTKGITRAHALLTLNPTTARAVAATYDRHDAVSTYTGIDFDRFRPYSEEEVAHLRARLGDGPFAIHSTDLGPIKRSDLALRAFAAASAPGKLIVTATSLDPARVARFESLVAELGLRGRVEFLGFVDPDDLPRLYSMANVLIQTGVDERMSLPVKEALACGTPAIRSDVTDEDVQDGVSGFLVDPRAIDATAERIALLMADSALSEEMGAAGRRRMRERFSWDRVAEVILEAAS